MDIKTTNQEVSSNGNSNLPSETLMMEDLISRDWIFSPEGKKFTKQMFPQIQDWSITSPTPMGILEEPSLPPSVAHDVREVKIAVFGKNGAGKSATISNLCGQDIAPAHVETPGIQVIGCYWPVHLKNTNRVVVFKFKFWDCGTTAFKTYSYMSDAIKFKPRIVIYVFSMTDKDSMDYVDGMLKANEFGSDVIRIGIVTKSDSLVQAQITKQDLVEFSQKHHLPIYPLKNVRNHSTTLAHNDTLQNQKDVIKLKNDLAEFILAEKDYVKRVKLFQNLSRFRVTEKKVASASKVVGANLPRVSSHPLFLAGNQAADKTASHIVAHPTAVMDPSHPSFELVYGMLYGIRNAVVETSAKRANREENLNLDYSIPQIVLLPGDYNSAHRYYYTREYVLDEEDNTQSMTQDYQYVFRFTDFGAFVFYNIRNYFGYNTAEYLDSLTKDVGLHELRSPGKSGSFFYFSLDYKFIIKTVNEAERDYFRWMLQNYYQHMTHNPNTALVKFYGLHSIQPRGTGRDMAFTVMDNAFYTSLPIHEKYDLKGSTVGRSATDEEKEKEQENAILKDLDIKRKIKLGKELKQLFLEQLEADAKFLEESNVMDYSFLLGISRIDPKNPLPPEPIEEGSRPQISSIWKRDYGGIFSVDRDEVYFFTIIDIFQQWNVRKKVENSFKSLMYEANGISAVPPSLYRERFVKFIGDLVE